MLTPSPQFSLHRMLHCRSFTVVLTIFMEKGQTANESRHDTDDVMMTFPLYECGYQNYQSVGVLREVVILDWIVFLEVIYRESAISSEIEKKFFISSGVLAQHTLSCQPHIFHTLPLYSRTTNLLLWHYLCGG